MSFRFEKLDVWREARLFALDIYKETRHFPSDEKYGLTNQIRRAVVSIVLNIAEGSDRKSDLEFKRFLRMSIGSCEEVVTALYIAKDLGFVNENNFAILYQQANNLVARINALIKSLH
jgi:four helix bundle protein